MTDNAMAVRLSVGFLIMNNFPFRLTSEHAELLECEGNIFCREVAMHDHQVSMAKRFCSSYTDVFSIISRKFDP